MINGVSPDARWMNVFFLQLFTEVRLPQKILEAWDDNEQHQ